MFCIAERTSPVVDVQWDKLSSVYLLVAYTSFVSLWDSDSGAELLLFDKQHNIPLTGLSWLDWTAGNYITSNAKTGSIRVWNASQPSPLTTIKVIPSGNMGIHAHVVVPQTQSIVCALNDGSVTVFSLSKMQNEFSTPGGHTHTIYEVAFCPTNVDVFASCSYDGTVKIWAISTMQQLKAFTSKGDNNTESPNGGNTIFYCVSWSVSGKKIAASTDSGRIVVWDVGTGVEMLRYQAFSKVT